MFKLVYYVPESHLEATKDAVFAVGAGRLGDYEHCCWQVKGMGQFKPLDQASPFIGQAGQLEQVEEYRVELICVESLIADALYALKQAHPYEEPAYEVTRLENL